MAGKEDSFPRAALEIAGRQHRRGQIERQRAQPMANLVAEAEVVHPGRHVGLSRPGEEVEARAHGQAAVDSRLLIVIPDDRKHAELIAAAGNPVERTGRIAVSHEVAERADRDFLRRAAQVDCLAGDRCSTGGIRRRLIGRVRPEAVSHQLAQRSGRGAFHLFIRGDGPVGNHRFAGGKGGARRLERLLGRQRRALRSDQNRQQTDERQTEPWHSSPQAGAEWSRDGGGLSRHGSGHVKSVIY